MELNMCLDEIVKDIPSIKEGYKVYRRVGMYSSW